MANKIYFIELEIENFKSGGNTMFCEKCQKNQATVHMTKIVNGQKVEVHLCSDCAKQMEFGGPISFQDIFQGLLDIAASAMQQSQTKEERKDMEQSKCPVCGLTYDGFKHNGKLGCAACYQTFRPQLDATLKSIHGSTTHRGKIPHKNGEELLAKKEMEHLKKELAKAIEEERYEDAAMYRDKIRAAQKGDASL